MNGEDTSLQAKLSSRKERGLCCTLAPKSALVCCAGRDKAEVRKEVGRNRYFTPEQAIE